jgi:hypothetical protein
VSLTRTLNITAEEARAGDLLEIDDGGIGPTQLRVVKVGPKRVELESMFSRRKRTMSRADFSDWAAGRYPRSGLPAGKPPQAYQPKRSKT